MNNHDHFILLCEKCNKVISQCRCPYLDKTRRYTICEICSSNIKAEENQNEKRLNIIDQISEIRAENNKNWVSILKLAFHVAPEEAKIIMGKIVKCDEQIKELCKELIK